MSDRKKTETMIHLRAWKDAAFKEKLLKNPKEALREMGMKQIPTNIQIKVVEEKKGEWVIRLFNRPLNYDQLSEKDLEKVAAGEVQESKCCPKI